VKVVVFVYAVQRYRSLFVKSQHRSPIPLGASAAVFVAGIPFLKRRFALLGAVVPSSAAPARRELDCIRPGPPGPPNQSHFFKTCFQVNLGFPNLRFDPIAGI
jgi:hypothetical protein